MSAVSLFLHSTGTTPLLWASVPDDVGGDVEGRRRARKPRPHQTVGAATTATAALRSRARWSLAMST